MSYSQNVLSFAELNQRLHKDEEWLRDFQEALNKSNQIQQSVCTLLGSFQDRIDSLSANVATLYTKSSVIQREQQNIRKLLSTVDATIQFHGKTTALENTIRDGNVMLALDDYLEKMRTLKEAIAFFSTHLTYKNKLEHVKLIYEIGYSNIEAEFSNLVRYSCVPVDAKKLFECLDDDYEMSSFRLSSFMTLRDVQKIHQIASWLLEHSDSDGQRQFLQSYSQFRAENMMKPLQFIADQIGPNNRVKSGQFVKTALKKAASRIADSNDQLHRDNAIAVTLFMLSSTVVLIQLETEQSSAVFVNVSVEAEVLRQIVGACLGRVLSHALRVVDSYEGSFMILLPLARFMLKHANQLASLSENLGESAQFASLQSSLYRKSIILIKDYRSRLSEDQIGGRFLPQDGNVHPISSGTLNLLKVLVQQQKLLNQLIQRAEVHESPGALAVQILKALSQNLRQKSSTYEDPALASLFMINNLQYIGQTVSRERTLLALLQGDQTAFPSSFETEAESYLQQFLKVWAKVGDVFNSDLGPGEDKRSVKSIFTVFTREFDAIVEQQKIYCVADQITANNVRMRIKSLVLQPFVEFSKKNSQECSELFEADRQLKYDAETIEMIIDRLFDATL